jgi:hypothetical protein
VKDVRIHVAGFPDSDLEERAELAWELLAELRELDAYDVRRPPASAPPGAKGDALEWAELVVSVAGTLPPLLGAVQSWLGRRRGASVTLEVDGDRLTLADPSPDERRELIETWTRRHGDG